MIKEIEKLIDLLEERNLAEIKYKNKDTEIFIKKDSPIINQVAYAQTPRTQESAPEIKNTIKSPLVGTYYSKPAPDMAPFITVGSSIKKGDVICIIEAMKVMNELRAAKDGVVKAILKTDGDVVGFDEDILVIE